MLFALTVPKGRYECNTYSIVSFFLSVMPPKDLAPFSYIYPRENPLSMIKYKLSISCRWCFLTCVQLHQQMGKKLAHTNPAMRLREKFLSLMRYNLYMGVNETRVKILPLLCRLGLVLRSESV